MLLPDQVIPFLQHDDPIVRRHASRYFRRTSDFGTLTADHYWAVIDRLGPTDEAIGLLAEINDLPQTDASLRRVVKELAAQPAELVEFHCQHIARNMTLAVLARNREELLACPQLLPHVRAHLELRLRLLDEAADAAWERLLPHGRELAGQSWGSFNTSLSDALAEAAARGGAEICEKAMTTLAVRSAIYSWQEIFAIRVLGLARYAPAVDLLVARLRIDADIMRDEVNIALSQIATPEVIDRIVDFYPGKPWHVRLYAHSSLANIKRPQSVPALMTLLDIELAAEAADSEDEGSPLTHTMLSDLTRLGSLAALEQSRQYIAADPEDAEALDLCEGVLATAIMTGTDLPEESIWRESLEQQSRQRIIAVTYSDPMFKAVRDNWRKTAINFPYDNDAEAELDRDFDDGSGSLEEPYVEQQIQPIRNTAAKIGRNDPCPCGSGKKYKKCCGNK